MQCLRVFLKTSLLISLSVYASKADAQPNTGAKKKIAMGAIAGAPPVVPARGNALALPQKSLAAMAKASYPSSHLEKGYYFKQQKKLNEALLEFIRAAQENPREQRAFYEQAQIFKEQGRIKLAKSALEQGLAVSPGNSQMRSYLVQLHFESGNLIGAASEVGKLFSINSNKPAAKPEEKPASEKISMQDVRELYKAQSAAAHVARGAKVAAATDDDAASMWLHSAASPEKEKTVQMGQVTGASRGVEDVLASIGGGNSSEPAKTEAALEQKPAAPAEAKGETFGKLTPNSVADILKSVSGDQPKSKKHGGEEEGKLASAALPHALSAGEQDNNASLMARMRSSASRVMTRPTEWVKNHLPSQDAAEKGKTVPAAERPSVLSWMKDKLPFGADDAKEAPKETKVVAANTGEKKTSRALALLSNLKEKMPDMPFRPHEKDSSEAETPAPGLPKAGGSIWQKAHLPFNKKSPSDLMQAAAAGKGGTVTTTLSSAAPKPTTDKAEASNSTSNNKGNAEIPLEVARILEGKFAGANVTTSQLGEAPKKPQEDKARKEMNEQLKHVLDSVPALKEDRETPRPEISGPKYGLLKNNALAHIASSDIPKLEPGQQKPSFLNNMMQQARKTFSSFMPSISWSWPSLPALPIMKPEPSPEAIVASVPAPLSEEERAALAANPAAVTDPSGTDAQKAENRPGAPLPVPLDVSRILGKLSTSTPNAPAPNPIAAPLSASIPIAAAPASTINAMIPKPLGAPSAPSMQNAGLPIIEPKGLERHDSANSGPHSSPQQSPQMPQVQSLPPIVQEVVNQAQPIIKPALDAANSFVHNLAPMAINRNDSQTPAPIQSTSSTPIMANNVPVPVGVDMSRYVVDSPPVSMAPDGLSAGPAQALSSRRIIDIQKTKSGAFTFMKPIIDGDASYFRGGKQVRTIQPLPVKAQAAPPPPPEDPITKRMRYLLEHGTTNLRRGEAFMFSEETGEGTLFLPDGTTERRKLKESQDHDQVLRKRRPDIIQPKDLQYSLSLLGKLLPPQNSNNGMEQQQPVNGPSLDQLLQQMDNQKKGFMGWMKKSFGMKD